MEFEIRKCKGKAALTINPKKQLKLNLLKLIDKFHCFVETKPMLIINFEGMAINVYEDGKLRIPLTDKEKASKIAEKIYKRILWKKYFLKMKKEKN